MKNLHAIAFLNQALQSLQDAARDLGGDHPQCRAVADVASNVREIIGELKDEDGREAI